MKKLLQTLFSHFLFKKNYFSFCCENVKMNKKNCKIRQFLSLRKISIATMIDLDDTNILILDGEIRENIVDFPHFIFPFVGNFRFLFG